MAEHRADIYTRITAEIIAAIEAGAGQWKMPWHHDGSAISRRTNVGSERRYLGVNVIAIPVATRNDKRSDATFSISFDAHSVRRRQGSGARSLQLSARHVRRTQDRAKWMHGD